MFHSGMDEMDDLMAKKKYVLGKLQQLLVVWNFIWNGCTYFFFDILFDIIFSMHLDARNTLTMNTPMQKNWD